jgi:hypothetical protein
MRKKATRQATAVPFDEIQQPAKTGSVQQISLPRSFSSLLPGQGLQAQTNQRPLKGESKHVRTIPRRDTHGWLEFCCQRMGAL